jgi:hypothetical protein
LLVEVNGRPTGNTLQGWCAATRGLARGQSATLSVVAPGAGKPEPVRVRFG